MEFSAQQIADLLQGIIEGESNVKVNTLSKIEEGKVNSLSFLANPKYTPHIYTTESSIVIVNKDFVAEQPIKSTLIRVEDAYSSFAKLLSFYNQIKLMKPGIEQPSFIAESAKVGKDVYVGAFAYIGNNVKIGNNVRIYPNCFVGENVVIGDDTILFSGVKIYSDCIVGAHCTLHSGVVIGGDGFGFAPNNGSDLNKVPQIGNVIIEDHVEIGSNSCVDRATLGSTIIKRGVKLDNLVQIAHNVVIGENTVIAGQSGVAGSTKVGKNVMIAAQVGVAGHLVIADGVKIAGQSGIGQSITKENEIVQGSPAFSIGPYKRSYVAFRNLPEILDRIKKLEQEK